MTRLVDLAQALAKAESQPTTTFESLYSFGNQLIGAKLFTLMVIDSARGEARRIYTNMPDSYPLLGTKAVHDDPWFTRVQVHHETFVANTIEAIAEVFFDYDLIQSLGCESVINIPVVVSGQILGTINCLHEAGHYTPNLVALSEELKLPGAAAFLLNSMNSSQGNPS